MVADISHQVKTPIANVRMYHSLLEKKNLDEEKRQQFLAAAERQTDKAGISHEEYDQKCPGWRTAL